MDKGIRQGVSRKFAEMIAANILKDQGGKKFRRQLLDWTVGEYSCSMAAASTHYNHAFQAAKKATPELVQGLGRPEGKNNGGRKKKVVAAPDASAALAANMLAARSGNEGDAAPAAVITDAAAQTGLETLQADAQTPAAPTLYTVKKASDGTVVAEGLSVEDADALIDRAAKAKKGKLVREEQTVAA